MVEEAGKICEKSSFFFDWTIEDFFPRLKKGLRFISPKFVFCDGEFFLDIIPEPALELPLSLDTMALMLTNMSNTRHYLICKVTITEGNGKEHMCTKDVPYSVGPHGSCEICYFDDYIDILQDPKQKAPTGALTISCILTCNQHVEKWKSKTGSINSEKLLQDMEALYFNGNESDVTLMVQNRIFPVHRSILGARSSVFKAMFSHDTTEATSRVVTITDFDPKVFHDFLLYVYSSKVKKLSQENVIGLYRAADKYDTQELKMKCVEYMRDNLSLDTFCSVLSVSLLHKESSLLEVATKFFIENLKQIIVSVEWQTFLTENPVAANELHIKAAEFYVAPKRDA